MDLTDLKPTPGSKHKKKREARGRSGYGGKTAGRGHNGQGQRAGGAIRKQFEGGQTPLYRRLPKHQYISSPNRLDYTVINLSRLDSQGFAEGTEVTPELLLEKKIIKKLENGGLKILGNGELKTKKLKIKAHSFSASAEEKIKKAGSSIEKIEVTL
jgi:large subunit ribosomal protein L15